MLATLISSFGAAVLTDFCPATKDNARAAIMTTPNSVFFNNLTPFQLHQSN